MQHTVVSQNEWLAARRALLAREKEFTRARDALSAEVRALPWVKIEKNYVFDGPDGRESLADLFGGKSQLMIYHFMLGPGWVQGCPSCSFVADHFDGAIPHLAQRDVALIAVSRAPSAEIEAYRKRMGWKFKWVSSNANDFNFDYGVSFTSQEQAKNEVTYNYGKQRFESDEMPGVSVFYKDESGQVFHTYSTYRRGVEVMMGTYNLLDLTPKGRDEHNPDYPMDWVRHHDRYEPAPVAQAAGCCHAKA